MSDYNNNYHREPASSAQGTAAVTLSGITAGLQLLANGGLGNIFGNNQQMAAMQKEMQDLAIKNAVLTSATETDKKLVEVYNALYKNDKEQNAKIDSLNGRVLALETASPLKEQIVDQKIARVADSMTCCCNAANAAITNLQNTLAGITKVVIPNTSVCPGWGAVTITPTAPTTAPST